VLLENWHLIQIVSYCLALCGISYKFLKLKHSGHKIRPPLERHIIGALKKAKRTFALENASRERSILDTPTLRFLE